jgi:alpha-D-xyloside xylohydrolase
MSRVYHSLLVVLYVVSWGTTGETLAQTSRLQGDELSKVANGVWRVRFGRPEQDVPTAFRQREAMTGQINGIGGAVELPFALETVLFRRASGRLVVYIPCELPDEEIYGFGLDPGAYRQKGLRKYLTVSAQTWKETGASHGPVPFYVSTAGYGVYVDTARVPFVHVARLTPKGSRTDGLAEAQLETSETALYAGKKVEGQLEVVFDVPAATGVDVYIFGGPTLREAVQRYILFSGGGCIPPMWGLGLKYRTYTKADQATAMDVAQALRRFEIPCDMFGLEPGWQTHAYSSSLVWSQERFPDPEGFISQLDELGFRLNLWEHAYIHPSSPLFNPLGDRSGDYLVWEGLVVDFVDGEASRLFAEFHDAEFVQKGVAGFKLDECDRQIITDSEPFNYPYVSSFPSGIDGDQMTQLYGYLYQKSIYSVFQKHNLRTWGDVRATGALAAPLPFNLYSDAYGFDQYLRQLVNASFCGLLWSPEVRRARTFEELANRVAMSAFASQMCLDIWFAPNPIWLQFDGEKNKANELLPADEQLKVADMIREIVNLRMSLLPYFYSAFYDYRYRGIPPTRSLLLDVPDDQELLGVDNQFMFGKSILVAPFMGKASEREVYFPKGRDWVDYRTNLVYRGGSSHRFAGKPGEVPLFVKLDTLLPVANPLQYVGSDAMFEITVQVYGNEPLPFTLYEDDGETFDFEKGERNRVLLEWSEGKGAVSRYGSFEGRRYRITGWKKPKLKMSNP